MRVELSTLRKCPGAASWLKLSGGVRVHATSDVADFRAAVDAGSFGRAFEIWDRKVQFLRGLEPKNAPAFSDWKVTEQARLETLYRHALLGQAELLAEQRVFAEAAPLLERALELDPLDEVACRALMRLEQQRGCGRAALDVFDSTWAALAEVLNIAHSPETEALADDIRRGLGGASAAAGRIPLSVLRPPMLAGRADALTEMEAAWKPRRIWCCITGARRG